MTQGIVLFHNIRWSRYKAAVFSALHVSALAAGRDVAFYQIAETERSRIALTDVDVSYHKYPHELLFPGSYQSVPKPRLVGTLFARVFRSRARLVLLPGYDTAEYWAMLAAAILSGKKRMVFSDSTLQDRPQSRTKGWLKRLFFRLCHGFFTYGRRGREYLAHYGAPADAIFHRCQAAALPPAYSESAALRRRLDLAPLPSHPAYLYVGRLSREKSLDTLLRAFAQVRRDLPAATLTLVGSGPQRDELEALAADIGVADAARFAGSAGPDELAAHYAAATCLVLPSRSEPWGLVVNEALHYGCPVVVSDHCGCVPELVVEGETGFSFRTDDVAALAAALQAVPAHFADVEASARRCLDLIAGFTPERAATQILAGCDAVLGARS